MLILVINCGSSSVKYQLFNIRKHRLIAKGIVERIGSGGESILSYEHNGKKSGARKFRCPNHYVAIERIVGALEDRRHGVIKEAREIIAIGHRVVHGQEEFKTSCLITKAVIRSLRKYVELAPLHNPPSLAGIKACGRLLAGTPQVAVFDTSFHQTMPPRAFLYGLPYEFYKTYAVRRYGFHGTSHRYVALEAAKALGRPLKTLRLITCHLGNGCSMTAVCKGESVDTTMGFTPLEGLLMGTRSGDLDTAAALYIMEKKRLSSNDMCDLLNKKSGLLGISGASNDMRDLKARARKGHERARLAIEVFVYRIKKYIGAYYAAMGALDAVVFTAGIGENNPWLIKRIEKEMRPVVGKAVRFMVVPTNEELLIAKDTYEIIKRRKDAIT